jgi:peroxiredoxin
MCCFCGWVAAFGLAMIGMVSVVADGPSPKPAATAPRFKLKDLDGAEVKLSDFEGKAVVLVFWASWDEPSRKQMVTLAEVHRQWADKPVAVVGLSLDTFKVTSGVTNQTSEASVKSFAMSNAIRFPVVFATAETIAGFGGLQYLPTTFVLDTNHVVLAKHEGVTEKSVLDARLKALFAATAVPQVDVVKP